MDQSLIEQSKRKFIVPEGKIPNTDEVKTGCLQRIATATETMAEGFAALLGELQEAKGNVQFYKTGWDRRAAIIEKLERQVNGYKGQLAKMRKQIQKLKNGES
jgi:hypothetical protein